MQEKIEIGKYINQIKEHYVLLYSYINQRQSFDIDEHFQKIINFNQKFDIPKNINFFKRFVLLIANISNNIHRESHTMKRIFRILKYYQDQIQQNFSNMFILDIFKENPLVLLFLYENKVFQFNSELYDKICHTQPHLCSFFYPELKTINTNDKNKRRMFKYFTKDIKIDQDFENKRHAGENDSYLCSLIRKDSIKEFTYFINKYNLSVFRYVEESIFETNSYLIENHPTIIEYAAFFGAVKIINFLHYKENHLLTSSIWFFAIHSRNSKLIHFFENQIFDVSDENFVDFASEAIKCHHNEIADYFIDCKRKENLNETKEDNYASAFCYHNYNYITYDIVEKDGLFYACRYNYHKLFSLLLKIKEKEIKKKIVLKVKYFYNVSIILDRDHNFIFDLAY